MHILVKKKFSHSFAMNFVIGKRKELLWIVVLTPYSAASHNLPICASAHNCLALLIGLTHLLAIWKLSTRAISKVKRGWLPWKQRMTSAHLINVRASANKRLKLCTPKRRGLYAPKIYHRLLNKAGKLLQRVSYEIVPSSF